MANLILQFCGKKHRRFIVTIFVSGDASLRHRTCLDLEFGEVTRRNYSTYWEHTYKTWQALAVLIKALMLKTCTASVFQPWPTTNTPSLPPLPPSGLQPIPSPAMSSRLTPTNHGGNSLFPLTHGKLQPR